MRFDDLLRKWDWRPIVNCPGRYVLQSSTDLQPQDIVGQPVTVDEFTVPAARDSVLVVRLDKGGLISYHRKDGSILHTLNTAEGFERKLRQLGIWEDASQSRTAKAVLFDIYGTLVEFRGEKYHSPYSNLLASLHLNVEQRRQLLERLYVQRFPYIEDFVNLINRVVPDTAIPDDLLHIFQVEIREHIGCAALYEGAKDVLVSLRQRGYRLALVSNLATPYVESVRSLGLAALVDQLIYSCEVGWRKPQPEIFRYALKQLHVAASEALFVGDTQEDDIEGATAVGMRAILVDREADHSTARSICKLTDILEMM